MNGGGRALDESIIGVVLACRKNREIIITLGAQRASESIQDIRNCCLFIDFD